MSPLQFNDKLISLEKKFSELFSIVNDKTVIQSFNHYLISLSQQYNNAEHKPELQELRHRLEKRVTHFSNLLSAE